MLTCSRVTAAERRATGLHEAPYDDRASRASRLKEPASILNAVRSRGRMLLCWPWLSLLPGLAASALPMHADYRPSADGRAIETESPSGRYFNRPL